MGFRMNPKMAENLDFSEVMCLRLNTSLTLCIGMS